MLNENKLPIDSSEDLNDENIFNEIILNSLRTSDGINMNYIKNNFSQITYKNLFL